ncbi:MAG: MmgE/PrpD family protein [Pseudomonadota bacterium]
MIQVPIISNDAATDGTVSVRVSERLAEFLSGARWEDIPSEVRHEAKRSLMNFFATSLGGCQDAAVETAFAVLGQFAGSATATIIGRSERSDLLNAAFLNAISANVFDFDDTHARTIIHPTAPVAPALFALAETSGMSGQQLLLAFVLGVETECRLGNAISPGHYQRGWHITSTCGVFGAAAAVGSMLGLSGQRMKWALGNASAQASGLVETLGSMAKSISVGNAARNGLVSALLAGQDFFGPDRPLEGARGFLRVTGENPDFTCVTQGLGEHWEILSNAYKPYPCGVVLNPVIEACLELSKKPELSISDIERIDLIGHPLLRERTDRMHVATGREAQVSAQHSVAVALARGRAGLAEFSDECVADPALRSLGSKVNFVDDASRAVESARVTVHMRAGRPPLSLSVDVARGSSARPLSDADLESKLKDLTQYGASGCDPEPLIQAIWSLERAGDAGSLMPLAAGRR